MMLVLSRKPNESIVINENIVVTILGVIGNRVRLGIEAPREVSVFRTEVLEDKPDKPDKPDTPVSKRQLRVTA